jgi:hypothetical protein
VKKGIYKFLEGFFWCLSKLATWPVQGQVQRDFTNNWTPEPDPTTPYSIFHAFLWGIIPESAKLSLKTT